MRLRDARPSSTDLPVVTCAGLPRERGEQHGEALRDAIADGLARWAESIASAQTVAPDAYISGFVRGTDFLPAIRRWTPDLLDELEGIARGAGQPWEWIYAYNLLDEEWTWASDQKADSGPGCTVAGFAPGDGTPLLAQTMDIPNVHDGTQAVLRIEPDDGPAALVFTHAGMIALTGCNADGLALVVNNLDMLPASRAGLPVAFVVRGILERRTLADGVSFVREVAHATGQHYGLAGPEGLASVEGWATGVSVRMEPGTRLLHTNHPLYTAETVGDVEPRYQRSRTRERLAYLERDAGEWRDVAGVQALLSDCTVPVSLGPERRSMTFGAVMYECSVPPAMWVAPGPPHLKAFRQVGWRLAREPVELTPASPHTSG
jgi:isopenicillin-N N-acyltransferase like protein